VRERERERQGEKREREGREFIAGPPAVMQKGDTTLLPAPIDSLNTG